MWQELGVTLKFRGNSEGLCGVALDLFLHTVTQIRSKTTAAVSRGRPIPGGIRGTDGVRRRESDLLVEFGVWGALVNEQPDDPLVPLPCGQVQGVAALIVGDVGQGLVTQQWLHNFTVEWTGRHCQKGWTLCWLMTVYNININHTNMVFPTSWPRAHHCQLI
jgi:hypothetical protein